jgi:predicted acylesterase/phospholipase RssA
MKTPEITGLAEHTIPNGKLGLALSGGGFRAALFHIGVLARLAERDLLRHVAFISTVSGGSIICAFYYHKVKNQKEANRPDGLRPSAQAYWQLVQEVEVEFLAAIQNNMRIMTFSDPRENARMLSSESSSTQRVADLFDSYFYAPITGRTNNLLRDLPITPAAGMLNEAREGEHQLGQVPQLILNATALNTGHLFQFTGTHIGEPSISSVLGGTTTIPQLQQLYMDDPALSPAQRSRLDQITLGEAVAASCCVPGLLDPLCLHGLYHDVAGEQVMVRLVDGGVFDNQGLVSLLEEQCTHFICSDASDLLQWQSDPENVFHAVAMRANDIFMDRIRIELMQKLLQREPGHVAVFNLGDKQGSEEFGSDATRFVQLLKSIRTDLDAFSDIEAWSLMYHGYMTSEHHLFSQPSNQTVTHPESTPVDSHWQFTGIRQLTQDIKQREHLLRHLDVGSRQFFKVFYLGKPLPWLIAILPTLIPIGFSLLLIYLLPPIPTSAWVVLGLIVISAVAFNQNARIVGWMDQITVFKRLRKKLVTSLEPLGITVILGMTGALASWINLKIFCPLFLRYGRLEKRL